MDEFEAKIHRTWIQSLIEFGYSEVAAFVIDTEICINYYQYDSFGNGAIAEGITIDVPIDSFTLAKHHKDLLFKTLRGVCRGHIFNEDSSLVDTDDIEKFYLMLRVELIEIDDDWKNVTRNLIANSKKPNQGIITEKSFDKKGKDILLYNEMKFASKSEVRIAQELESLGILFFPLPLAVRCESGDFYKDHREVDFLICNNGSWGILEVSYHPDRYEKDSEKNLWFKKSGILCIENFTAERCYNYPEKVVQEFLEILNKFTRQ